MHPRYEEAKYMLINLKTITAKNDFVQQPYYIIAMETILFFYNFEYFEISLLVAINGICYPL